MQSAQLDWLIWNADVETRAKLAGVNRQIVGRPLTEGDVVQNLRLLERNYLGLSATKTP
ncbi:MAG: hypothetical protein ACHQUB_02895 [Candidatus Saccharimonadia bacterium]